LLDGSDWIEGEDLAGRGTEAGRGISSEALLAAAVGAISPSAAASLLVNEEIAQPAQDLSLELPMRASDLLGSGVELVGGCITVSAIVLPNLRTRWM
jgi:hypothetical protein